MASLCRNAFMDGGKTTMNLIVAQLESPIGEVRLASTESGICAVDFADRWPTVEHRLELRFGKIMSRQQGDPYALIPRLKDYFDGAIETFDGLVLDPGGTLFQRSVWSALREIHRGETWNYSQLAAHVGNPKAVRAVGSTNARNPIAIIVPCHRVIGKGGELRGYAGGLDRKRWLLELEGCPVKNDSKRD